MPLTPLHPVNRETVDRIQQNLIAYFRLFAGLPGITFVEEDVIWIASEGLPGNLVLQTRISDDTVDRGIDEILSRIGQYTDSIDWFVFPGCRPADLGTRLAARGTEDAGGPWRLFGKIGGPGGAWMVADLTCLPAVPSVSDGFRIEYVHDHNMLEAWARISSEGFGHDAHLLEKMEDFPFYDAYARHGFGPDAFSLRYIGYMDDRAVTSSTLLLAGGIAGIFDVATPPSLRRRGFGGAITRAMMQEAQERGYRHAYVWSSPMGRGVYGDVGFVAVDIGMREYQWQKR